MIAIDDPGLPGLADLTEERLRRITGATSVTLMRFRYRAGKRAILHVGTGVADTARQGTLWFFQGDKAQRLAETIRSAAYDASTGALYECFPNDHRMPQIAVFLDGYRKIAPGLIGGVPVGIPELLRYRPGLSCTFRCHAVRVAGPVFVKLINDESPGRLAVMNRRMSALMAGGPLSVAPVVGIDAETSAIAYGGARGQALDAELAATGNLDGLLQSLDALRRFSRLAFTPTRQLNRAGLLSRAAEGVDFISFTVPSWLPEARRILTRLETVSARLPCRPIHADVKLEHLFLDGGRTTLIDTESVSLGPPDYDLAQLYGRLWQAEVEGVLPEPLVRAAAAEVRRSAGEGFDWCLGVVALRLAKFYAQRPGEDAVRKVEAIFARLR